MRSVAVRAVLLAFTGVALLAPGAAAGDYTFLASDTTKCVLSKSHGVTPLAGGTYDVGFGSGVLCDRPAWSIDMRVRVFAFPSGTSGPRYYDASPPYAYCTPPGGGGFRPCGTWNVATGGTARGVPAGRYEHQTEVVLRLKPATGTEPPAVWAVTPLASGCVTSGDYVWCEIREPFTLP